MAFGDINSVTLQNNGRRTLLNTIFDYTGSAEESTTQITVKVKASGGTVTSQTTRTKNFTTSPRVGVSLRDLQFSVGAGITVTGFTITEYSSGQDIAEVNLDVNEQVSFTDSGILYVEYIYFNINLI